ncbi:MAG: thiol-disulfide isomerase [Acidobacteriota bacterium]|nr:thiol-disulfide isomerase [Acidobacteriota bacterium]
MNSTLAITAGAILAAGSAFAANTAGANAPTFSKDVAPILYKSCVSCHRPGEAAPMALRSYTEVRPWAKAIKQQVATRTMPPWHADPTVNHFSNDRRLSDAEVATVVKWADAGAPEGKPADLPKLPEFTEGWVIGKPDLVLENGVTFPIPATGVVDYKYYKVDPGFKEDTWIQAAEVRPSQRKQVHHILVFVQQDGKRATRGGEQFSDMLIGYAPGVPSIVWDPDTAFLVKAGSKLLFQVHYTTNGTATSDHDVLGLKIRKDPPKYRALTGSAVQFRLSIPPNDPNYEAKATQEFKEDATLLDLTPHMHLRGKAFKYVLTYPDGRTEELLNVPHYDFNWQLSYVLAEPRVIPAGSKIEATAWYDNTANNKYNPDPTQTVKWGDQTFNEMMIGFFNYKVPVDRAEPATGTKAPEKKTGAE